MRPTKTPCWTAGVNGDTILSQDWWSTKIMNHQTPHHIRMHLRPPQTPEDHLRPTTKIKARLKDPILSPAAQPKFKNSKHQMTDYFVKTKTTKGENLLLMSPKPSRLPGRSEEFLKDHNKLTMRLNNWPIEGQDTDTLSLRNFPSQEWLKS